MKPTRTCSIDGCESSYRMRRGWCNSHYIRWRKYGDPLKGGRTPYRDPRAALTERTERRGDCAIWLGATNGHGYGQLRINGVLVSAHRFAWEETNGPIPDGMKVDHRDHCDKRCVNVDHLRLATHAENNWNKAGAQSNSRTGVRNVYQHGNGYRVQLRKDGASYGFGTYQTIEDAALVAANARREMFGEFAGKG